MGNRTLEDMLDTLVHDAMQAQAERGGPDRDYYLAAMRDVEETKQHIKELFETRPETRPSDANLARLLGPGV